MERIVKHFDDLSMDALFAIYRLRVSVFVVENRNAPIKRPVMLTRRPVMAGGKTKETYRLI